MPTRSALTPRRRRMAAALGLALHCVRGKVPAVANPGDQLAADMAGRDRMRASHADREHAIEVLKTAFVQDRLTKDELETRVGQAFASRTYAELAALTADLPAKPIAAQPSRPARARGERRIPPGTVLAVATVLYAGMWPLAIALPRDWEGEPQAGINLIAMTTGLYLLGLILAGRLWLDSWREKRSGGHRRAGLGLSRVTARLWRLFQTLGFCVHSCCRSSEECPDGCALDVAAFQHALAGNVVAGQRRQPVTWQISPAKVANQNGGAAGVASFHEPHHLAGQILLVESVCDQHQIGAGGWEVILVQDVSADGRDRYTVGSSVHADSHGSDRVDIICGHGCCTSLGRRNGHQPRAGGNVDRMPASDNLRMVQKVAGQRQPAGPRERPERRIQPGPP
jgi:DUF1707 SHOCT-like domain